jgi:hypothetical protein
MENNPLLHYRIWAGFLAFAICAAFGLRLMYRGIRGDVCDSSGTPLAGRSGFIGGGILCLVPLVAYSVLVWKQGYFSH